jgi:hypothetical protein
LVLLVVRPALKRLERLEPKQLLFVFMAWHAIVWLLTPLLAFNNQPAEVMELFVWAKDPQLGYYKGPPLPAYLVWLLSYIIPQALLPYLLAQICVLVGMYFMYKTALLYTKSQGAAVMSAILLDTTLWFNVLSMSFNADILQVPLYAAAIYACCQIIVNHNNKYFYLLGFTGSLLLLTNYSTMIPIIALIAALLSTKDHVKLLFNRHYVASEIIFTILLLPHLYWLWLNDFSPFYYIAEHMQVTEAKIISRLLLGAKFALSQLLYLIPFFIAIFILNTRETEKIRQRHRHLLIICFLPFIITLCMVVFFGWKLKSSWAYAYWVLLPLVMVLYMQIASGSKRLVMTTVAIMAFQFILGVGMLYGHKLHPGSRSGFHGNELIAEIQKDLQTGEDAVKIDYVLGETWLAGNIMLYHPDHPKVLINGNSTQAPWVKEEQMLQGNAMVVWQGKCNLPYCDMVGEIHDAIIQPQLSVVKYGWIKKPDPENE